MSPIVVAPGITRTASQAGIPGCCAGTTAHPRPGSRHACVTERSSNCRHGPPESTPRCRTPGHPASWRAGPSLESAGLARGRHSVRMRWGARARRSAHGTSPACCPQDPGCRRGSRRPGRHPPRWGRCAPAGWRACLPMMGRTRLPMDESVHPHPVRPSPRQVPPAVARVAPSARLPTSRRHPLRTSPRDTQARDAVTEARWPSAGSMHAGRGQRCPQ